MSAPVPRSIRTRREFLAAGALTGLGVTSFGGASAATRRREDAELLDRAYERIQARLPDANPHRANHVAMVAEALFVLGRADAIEPWLDQNFTAYEPERSPLRAIEVTRWHEALGQLERFTDWRELFLVELAHDDWPTVLGRWVPRLVSGLAGSATHGVIRTGHAVRALGARDSELRRSELATGLAYWAATFEELPWDGSEAPESSVEAALARVEARLPARAPPRGNIVTGLRALRETPSFRPVAGLVDTRDPARTLSEMASAFARLYLANPAQRIPFTHSVTAPSALRLLAPHLDEETVRRGTRYAWQAAAGLFVVYGDPHLSPPAMGARATTSETIRQAVESGATHGIKLTEACLREESLSHDPLLLQAARDASIELHG